MTARPAPRAIPTERIEGVVDRLRRVPLVERSFCRTADYARRQFRIDGPLLSRVLDAGLPHVRAGDELLLDDFDLLNLALFLRMRSPQRAAMRYWADVLTRPAGEERSYLIDYAPACPLPGHPGPCRFLCCLPGDEERVAEGPGDGVTPVVTVPVTLTNDWPDAPEPLVELMAEIADVEFYRLPHRVKWDLDFMLSARIGDCLGFARYLVEHGARRGLPMRMAFGLIVAPPYSTPHYWAEVRLDGRWVPVDPGLVRGMAAWGALAEEWPAHRSPGALLVNLTTRHGLLVSHGGVHPPVSFRTRLG
ncbi:transglutaminase domain-containing protein [Streptomyces sp. DSM 44915]|uniref:Transglutaminase domain-containing protein n=1 Tax=Streptomyces chisholmiae TaxID=3075540 RepID=A0ABU2JPE6_9ACTN|nr:transglutaminase domain-containing protein [Streptomyces sp. DSM 44915]MDT0266589.1 transglutaminase domain-containing protein [Streptomyces sp. DSM 44915]